MCLRVLVSVGVFVEDQIWGVSRVFRIVGFNTRLLVFHVNFGGNVEAPPKNLPELSRALLGRELSREQKNTHWELFCSLESSLEGAI